MPWNPTNQTKSTAQNLIIIGFQACYKIAFSKTNRIKNLLMISEIVQSDRMQNHKATCQTKN